jgi:hypothetical protein
MKLDTDNLNPPFAQKRRCSLCHQNLREGEPLIVIGKLVERENVLVLYHPVCHTIERDDAAFISIE